MNRLRSELSQVRTLRLTKRGEWVRDGALGIAAVPFVYALILASIAGLEGLGL